MQRYRVRNLNQEEAKGMKSIKKCGTADIDNCTLCGRKFSGIRPIDIKNQECYGV